MYPARGRAAPSGLHSTLDRMRQLPLDFASMSLILAPDWTNRSGDTDMPPTDRVLPNSSDASAPYNMFCTSSHLPPTQHAQHAHDAVRQGSHAGVINQSCECYQPTV